MDQKLAKNLSKFEEDLTIILFSASFCFVGKKKIIFSLYFPYSRKRHPKWFPMKTFLTEMFGVEKLISDTLSKGYQFQPKIGAAPSTGMWTVFHPQKEKFLERWKPGSFSLKSRPF